MALRTDRYLDALTAQSALFAEVLHGADLQLRVPTCPDWTLSRLTEHLGQAHRWGTAIVTRRATAPLDSSELGAAAAPEDPDGLGTWLREGAGELVDAIRAAGPQTPVWSWADDQSVGFWARRKAHETAVHRADAELALDREFALEADLAADAISEWLSLLSSAKAAEWRPELAALRGEGQILHLHSTDPGLGEAGEWIVRRTPSGPVWERGHTKGDVAGPGCRGGPAAGPDAPRPTRRGADHRARRRQPSGALARAHPVLRRPGTIERDITQVLGCWRCAGMAE